MEFPKYSGGLIVVLFGIIGIAAFYPYYDGKDLCTNSGVWDNVTDIVYFNDTFPAIARYYCNTETDMTKNDCLHLDRLINSPGCKWGGKTSSTGRTLYVMIDPIWEGENYNVSIEPLENCTTVYWNTTSYYEENCTEEEAGNGTNYTTCDTGINITLNNRTDCINYGYDINVSNSTYHVEYKVLGECSYTPVNFTEFFNITCDTLYDSNMDGECTSGESCCHFYCNENGCNFSQDNCDTNRYVQSKNISVVVS